MRRARSPHRLYFADFATFAGHRRAKKPTCPTFKGTPKEFCLHHELQFRPAGDESGLVRAAEKTPDGFAAFLAVVERPVIDVHAHEFVREFAAHVAGVLKSVLHSFGTMIE